MIENGKTILLALLVAASLMQSYMLVYSEPKFDTIIPTDYVETELSGTQKDISELLFPKDIVLHLGNDEHVVLYPGMIFYRMILEVTGQRTFEGVRLAGTEAEVAGQGLSNEQGIEIRYAEELPLPLLQQTMNLRSDEPLDEVFIDRIQIFTNAEQDEVRVFFTGSASGVKFEATNADLTVKDIERFVGFGENGTRYIRVQGGHYLPVQPLPMLEYRYGFQKLTADQLQRSLFPDPHKTRNLTERDGSQIYTDGKRGLQLSEEQLWMSYMDPGASVEGTQRPLDTVVSAVQFVNRQGGWDGTYAVESFRTDPNSNEQHVRFRRYSGTYTGAFPVLGTPDGLLFGDMRLSLRNRAITNYERSTVLLDESPTERQPTELPGGEWLLAMWNGFDGKMSVQSIFPAYRAVLTEEQVRLVPVWALSMKDGTIRPLLEGGPES